MHTLRAARYPAAANLPRLPVCPTAKRVVIMRTNKANQSFQHQVVENRVDEEAPFRPRTHGVFGGLPAGAASPSAITRVT